MVEATTPGKPTYYIENIDLSFNPVVGESILGNISVEIDMFEPVFDDESSLFTCECELYLELHASEVQEDDQVDHKMGEITANLIVTLAGNDTFGSEYFGDEIESWKEDGYEATSDQLKVQLESELLHDVFYPLSTLLDDSFRGIIPRIMFRSPSDSEESDSNDS